MNKNSAFTLIELMAVIILLAVFALIAIPNVDKKIKETRRDLTETQLNNVKTGARMWASENPLKLPDNGETCYLEYTYLVEEGYLEDNMSDPASKITYNNYNLLIYISKNSTSNQINYNVEFDKNRTSEDNSITYCNNN